MDSKNDLNIYKGVGEDGVEVACCGTKVPMKEPAATSCCGTKVPVKNEASSCCGPKAASQAESKDTCCSTDAEQGGDPSILSAKYADVDFNEWVGKWSQDCAERTLLISMCLFSRFISGVCREARV